jgi:ABC-type lipoprotein export system ATPase subunit
MNEINPVPKDNREVLLEAKDIEKVYAIERVKIQVLKGVSLSVRVGETVSIMGASGAGKSTLLHILGGLDRPTVGTVHFKGMDLYRMSNNRRTEVRGTRIGFVFQSYHLLPELDILENVMLPALSRFGAWSSQPKHRERAQALLDSVGLAARAGHRPMELSGGEQQRAALARALMNDPEIVLADEPTGNLDSKTGDQVLHYLFALTKERGHTLMLVTHNEAVGAMCETRLVLQDGKLAS